MFKLFINRLELNNRVWFRKVVRGLGGKLLPNFDVEELFVVNPDDNVCAVIIGESIDDYECIVNNKQVFISKYEVNTSFSLVDVFYKDLDACTMWCESRIRKIDGLKIVKIAFDVDWNIENDLVIDMFKREVEEYLKCASVLATIKDGTMTVKVRYISSDEKAYNKIKDKYGRKLYTKES